MKIAVFTPSYRHTSARCNEVIKIAVDEARCAGHDMCHLTVANCLVEEARNKCLGYVLTVPEHADTEAVLFIDDDMKPEPEAICKIIELNKPVASSLLTTRIEPVKLLVKRWDQDRSRFLWNENFCTVRPQEGPYATGAAFMFIRREVIESVKEYHISARDWMELQRPEMDRLRVRSEAREEERKRKERIRRENFARDFQEIELFSRDIQDDELRTAEDIGFYWRVLQCGIPVTIDPRIRVTHTGEKDYSWEDYIPPSKLEPGMFTVDPLRVA